MSINVRTRSGEHDQYGYLYALSAGYVPRRLVRIQYVPSTIQVGRTNRPWKGCIPYSLYNYTPSMYPSPPQPPLEDFISRYIKPAEARVKSIEAVQKIQTTSIQNMESRIKLLAKMIAEGPLGSSPRNAEWIPREH